MKITATATSTNLLALLTTAWYTTIQNEKWAKENYSIELLVPTWWAVVCVESLISPASLTLSRPLVAWTPFVINTKFLKSIFLITATTQVLFVTLW